MIELDATDRALLRAILLNRAEEQARAAQPEPDDPPVVARARRVCAEWAAECRRLEVKLRD